jgi:hypothetical protein
MQPVADLVEMTRTWAAEHYAGHIDSYSLGAGDPWSNNYYLHSDRAGRFSMVTTGTDQSLRLHSGFGVAGDGVLARHCFADRTCRDLYVDALRALQANPATAALPAQARAIRAAIAPWRVRDPRREVTVAEGESAADVALETIDARPAELGAWLESPAFPGIPPVDEPPADDGTPPGTADEPAGDEQAPEQAEPAAQPEPSTLFAGGLPTAAKLPALVPVRPVIGKPTLVPARLRAGAHATVTFRVTRSDSGRRLLGGRMDCNPAIGGRTLPHGDSFKRGTATLDLTVPRSAKGKLLEVRVTITFDGRRATRVGSFRIA